MERAELLRLVAPCGLVCFTCTAAKNGAIMQHSQTMLELLDGFDGFAERFSNYEPRLKKYPDFKDILLMFSEASCEGCRGGVCIRIAMFLLAPLRRAMISVMNVIPSPAKMSISIQD